MPTRPTGNEEQEDDDNYPRRQQRPQQPQRPAQQTSIRNKQTNKNKDMHYDDGYQSMPRKRRASRFEYEEEQPLPIITNKLPVVDNFEEYLEEEYDEPIRTSQLPHPTNPERAKMSRTSTNSVPAPQKRRHPYENYPTAPARSASKPIIREQYVRYGRHEKHPRVRTTLDVLRDFGRNPTLVAISIGVVLLLILLPILVNLTTRSSTGSVVSSMGQTNSGTSSSQSVSHQSSYPHELVITPPETDHPAPPVFATSAYLLDADTGNTLYAFNPFMHLPMMSTTKLMTATLTMEQGNLDQNVTINGKIANDLNTLSSDSSLMGIKKGETYTLRQLMYGLMLVSGNDAAIAIADTIGGNLPHFVTMMNTKAQSLDLLDTHYMNPHGLLATGHYSSAHDLAILGRYAFSIPGLRTIDGTRTYDIAQSSSHAAHHMVNGNQFLWWYPGVDGGKPGWDGGSNFVQVISCTRNGHHLIGVVMHTVNWWTDMRDLMNWGFDTFTWVSPAIVDKHSAIPYDNLWNYFSDDKTTVTIPTSSGRYYVYTGYSVSSPILDYFDHKGGLKKFGFPVSLLTASGSSSVSQKFQHATIQCDITSKQCKTA